MAGIFQNREQKFHHVGKCIAAHRMFFFLHRSSFETSHRRCAASQRVAGPYITRLLRFLTCIWSENAKGFALATLQFPFLLNDDHKVKYKISV